MTAPLIPPSAWDHGPTCGHCADYARGYAAAWADARAILSTCQHTHPAIAQSVAEMFAGWDGAEAAHRRSIQRFHAERRKGVQAA